MWKKLAILLLSISAAAAAQSKPVVVVELFTSEGCSSCPPADALLRDLQAHGFPGTELVLLGEHVDYWDHQGWRDAFSSHQFTARQQDYERQMHLSSAYTPQAVVDGRTETVGSEEDELRKAIADAAGKPKSLRLTVQWDAATQTAHLQSEGTGAGELYLAVTEDGLSSMVKAGENDGRKLSHAAVVRRLIDAGRVQGAFRKDVHPPLDPQWNAANLHLAAFVQDTATGAILGATSAKLTP